MKIETTILTEQNVRRQTGWRESELFVGSIGTKYVPSQELRALEDWDLEQFQDLELKDGERLFRISTERMRAIDYSPLVKINLDKSLIYYLEQGRSDEVVFQTRGIQLRYISLIEGII